MREQITERDQTTAVRDPIVELLGALDLGLEELAGGLVGQMKQAWDLRRVRAELWLGRTERSQDAG